MDFKMPDFDKIVNDATDKISNSAKENNELAASAAQANRDWQEKMSSTAHQREVADLKAAGLNPILSAGGNGAAVGSGATADVDKGATQALAGLTNSLVGAMAGLARENISAQVAQRNADLQAEVQRAAIQAGVQNAMIAARASTSAAGMSAAASKYAADRNYATAAEQRKHDTFIHQSFPSNPWQAFTPRIESMLGKVSPGLRRSQRHGNSASAVRNSRGSGTFTGRGSHFSFW